MIQIRCSARIKTLSQIKQVRPPWFKSLKGNINICTVWQISNIACVAVWDITPNFTLSQPVHINSAALMHTDRRQCPRVQHLCSCALRRKEPRSQFEQVKLLPCDVHHVVSWSGLLSCVQSFRQTHRCGPYKAMGRCGPSEIKAHPDEKYKLRIENCQEVRKKERGCVFID